MIESLSLRDKVLLALYRQGLTGLQEKLVLELPKHTAEWAVLARDVLADFDSAGRAEVVRWLTSPGFIEHHPNREELVELVAGLMTEGVGAEHRLAIRFVRDNLRLFPAGSDTFQMKVMSLQTSSDPAMAEAADDLLATMGIDLRDPALLGDSHDALEL